MVMGNERIKSITANAWLWLVVLLLAACGGYSVIPNQEVPGIPEGDFERIIKLDNPEGNPDRTLAGLVHITGKAAVCTDYPREQTIKSLDDLSEIEKHAFKYFQNYVIRDGAEILGYVSVPIEYRAHIWRTENNPQCRYKVQIVLPEHRMGNSDYDDANRGRDNR